jgi:hypothetical protein
MIYSIVVEYSNNGGVIPLKLMKIFQARSFGHLWHTDLDSHEESQKGQGQKRISHHHRLGTTGKDEKIKSISN